MKVKALLQLGLDDLKIGRHIKVAWRKQAVMTDAGDFFDAGRAIGRLAATLFDNRQDGIAHRLKSLSNQC